MKALKPFWQYYGGKWRAAPLYPAPAHSTIIEPFAGAAGYSLRYPGRNVILIEKYPVIAEIWRYLIAVRAAEVRRIPCVQDCADLPAAWQGAPRYLVGMCMRNGATCPQARTTPWMQKAHVAGYAYGGWTEAQRERVAVQVDSIRHWRVIEGDYALAPDVRATYFVDPPYQEAGVYYKCSSKMIDYAALSSWCRARAGQVIVCENQGATWLPFVPWTTTNTAMTGKKNVEVCWLHDDRFVK
jgi:hypothetical protein